MLQTIGELEARQREVDRETPNLKADEALLYANLLYNIHRFTFERQDIATMKRMNEIFSAGRTSRKDLPDSAFLAEPYLKSKQIK